MASFHADQAEGLRRILGAAKPKIFVFLSATSNVEKSTMLMNLGASLQRAGSSVLIMDAAIGPQSVSSMLGVAQNRTVLDGVRLGKNIHDAVREVPQGFSLATLMRERKQMEKKTLTDSDRAMLDAAFSTLMTKNDVMLVDAELDGEDMLPTQMLCDAHIVVQLSTSIDSIKGAYTLIKRLGTQLGRRPFSLIFTSADEKAGAQVFENMSRAATRYLAIQISSFGCVPEDDSIGRAVKQRRSVVEAFPMSRSSAAFRRIAQEFSAAVV